MLKVRRVFYYSFIDSNGKQIPTKTKETIINTLNKLDDSQSNSILMKTSIKTYKEK